jgi:hypothetical protein
VSVSRIPPASLVAEHVAPDLLDDRRGALHHPQRHFLLGTMARADDVQMDFTMLDPHIRTALKEDKSVSPEVGTTYTAKFRAPDRHGVFKFVVEYWRPG